MNPGRSPSPLTPVEIFTLAALSRGPRYGYDIVREIEVLSGGSITVRPGNLYRVLDRLEGRGLVGPAETTGGHVGRHRRQYYAATPAGHRLVSTELSMYARVLASVPDPADA